MELNSKIQQWRNSVNTKVLFNNSLLQEQQNGVVERKNITLIEAGRTMLEDANLPTYFWAEAINTACYTQNCSLINKHGKTLYEMVKGKKPSVKHLHVFGCKCFVLRTHPEQLGKFDTKADEGIFVGYPPGKTYKIFNLRTRKVIESINVSFDDGKITGMNEDDHERLSFGNKDFESNADDSNPDESTTDDSTPDELYADELELILDDGPNTDDPNPDNQEDSNATVEGDQQQDQSVEMININSQEIQVQKIKNQQILMTHQEIFQEKYQIQGELQIALQISQMMMELMQGEQLVLENSYHPQGNGQKITLLT